MRRSTDAYGSQVWAFYRGQDSYELVERDDGFVGLSGGAPAYFAPLRKWPVRQQKAIRLAKRRVLDVGCGAGRVALYLQSKGAKVVAIDNSPLAVKVSRLREVKDARVLPIEKIGRFPASSFDSIVMFGNNFGLFGGFAKARRILRIMHRITSPDAVILAESNDPYKTKDPVHRSYQRFNRKRGRMPGQLRIRVRFRDIVGSWFDYLLASPAELRSIVKGTGWVLDQVIRAGDDRIKGPYVAVIKKCR